MCTYCAWKNTPKISNTNRCYYVSALLALYLIINCLFCADDSSVLQIFARHSFFGSVETTATMLQCAKCSCQLLVSSSSTSSLCRARSINCCLRTKAIIKPLAAQCRAKWWIVTLCCNSHLLKVAGSKLHRLKCRNGARTTTERLVDGRVAGESREMGISAVRLVRIKLVNHEIDFWNATTVRRFFG